METSTTEVSAVSVERLDTAITQITAEIEARGGSVVDVHRTPLSDAAYLARIEYTEGA